MTEQGARIGIRSGRVVVSKGRDEIQQLRLIDVSQIAIYGNVQISSQMMRAAFREGIPICWFSYGGWFQGIARGSSLETCRPSSSPGRDSGASWIADRAGNDRREDTKLADVLEKKRSYGCQAGGGTA